MKDREKVRRILARLQFGEIALVNFILCVISGIVVAIPYDVQNAYDSVALMLITNPAAVFFRNIHYWSAQLFLVFTILHTLEHLWLFSVQEIPAGKWFRLVISLLVIFFVLLSGFILKADADGLQAYRILQSLIKKLPIFGNLLANFLLGEESNLQILYVHHITTSTLFLAYIIYEHAGFFRSKRSVFLISLAILTLLSYFIQVPLHNNSIPELKGPWYFIAIQEVTHWLQQPGRIWTGVLLLILLIFLTRYTGRKTNRLVFSFTCLVILFWGGLTVSGYYFRGPNWEWMANWDSPDFIRPTNLEPALLKANGEFQDLTSNQIPIILGKREACLVCHKDVTGFSKAHDPGAVGCVSCHLGNPFTLDKNRAHKKMVRIPGNIEDARYTCGTTGCHPEISVRLETSLMTTNSGIVSVDRFVFGEYETPDIQSHIKEIGYSPADKHLRDLCARCHLGKEKLNTGPINQLSRGGGCNACHLNYTEEGRQQHEDYMANNKSSKHLPSVHPSLSLQISNEHCFGCHSRSGRISTNYEGWHETLLVEDDAEGNTDLRILEDKRVFERIEPDVHHSAGIGCIDCHNSFEVMGDGTLYAHEEQAVKIRCEDCHFTSIPETLSYDRLDTETQKIFDLHGFDPTQKSIIQGRNSGIALVNTYFEDGKGYMISKNNKTVHPLNPPASVCSLENGHTDLSCSSCHSAWAPSCIGCHNRFEPDAQGYDLLEDRYVTGEWVEYVGRFLADAPALGVRESEQRTIEPAIPGMIMTIDLESFTTDKFTSTGEVLLFHRLYAPAAPHTTVKTGRSCTSCHNNPVVLGYGRGELSYTIVGNKGTWSFIPAFSKNPHDGLPEDAWIPFPENFEGPEKVMDSGRPPSTRTDFRPFTLREQKKILTVGACLTCHDENSTIIMNSLLKNFEITLENVNEKCILPKW